MVSASRVAAINPPIDDRTGYGNSVSTPEATRTCKRQQNSLQKGSRPHIVDTDSIADAVFAEAISETSILINSLGWRALSASFSFVNKRKSLKHRPVDPMFVPPAGVPGIYLDFMCLFLS